MPRLLHGVGGVVHDGRAAGGSQAREIAHVHHEIAVPEERPALGDGDLGRAAGPDLLDGAAHAVGGHPLPLLHVHRPARSSDGHQEIRLAAEECGDLEDVGNLRGGRHLVRLVNVRENRQPGGAADLREGTEAPLEPGSARALEARAVRLVVGGFVNHVDPESRSQLGQRFAHPYVQVVRLDDAGAGDEEWELGSPEVQRHFSRAGRGVAAARRPRSPRTGGAGAWGGI